MKAFERLIKRFKDESVEADEDIRKTREWCDGILKEKCSALKTEMKAEHYTMVSGTTTAFLDFYAKVRCDPALYAGTDNPITTQHRAVADYYLTILPKCDGKTVDSAVNYINLLHGICNKIDEVIATHKAQPDAAFDAVFGKL